MGEGTVISRTHQGSVSRHPSLECDKYSPRRVLFSEILLSENNIIVVPFKLFSNETNFDFLKIQCISYGKFYLQSLKIVKINYIFFFSSTRHIVNCNFFDGMLLGCFQFYKHFIS